ncbi:hypothetical protein SAICODRAFT_94475 [Saitoella complicata NRRL Y-17804]|nr:uncharacterized protein SAICODRAFT_94475 [Saitoella complicata NRRL Y-17804]ODQ51905.1 hypothetical protein SAICODRAFT_94475 [Saitoella complicata NRRL Y-17804]
MPGHLVQRNAGVTVENEERIVALKNSQTPKTPATIKKQGTLDSFFGVTPSKAKAAVTPAPKTATKRTKSEATPASTKSSAKRPAKKQKIVVDDDFEPEQSASEAEEDEASEVAPSSAESSAAEESEVEEILPEEKPKLKQRTISNKRSTSSPAVFPGAKRGAGADYSDLPPISSIPAMFQDMVGNIPQIADVAKHLAGRKLRVATMCSGTESPLLALGLISRAIEKIYGVKFGVQHVFSCEIEPFKQAYIERNFQPPLLFRDICELGNEKATTAYGAKATVPGDVDMLVAGTSCVDYSNLNNEKQDFEAQGESGQTFRGMMSWVIKNRPPVVILENVCNAPWDKVKKAFEKEGYSAQFQRFDTKQYYIPHTRTRVYLFAYYKPKTSLPEKWKHMVASLSRPASSPLEAFLLPSDDPRIHQAREKLVREAGSGLERRGRTDWGKCESRHHRARHEEGLGTNRPLTAWQQQGECTLPDFAWNDWGLAQTERVLDLLDVNQLRMALKGVDSAFKTLVWNLSQNVDRTTGSVRPGICPCLTPSMIPYITNRGGPLVGLEALSLQGLPVEELLLTRESEDNLADLAGNAMTSTVVGVSMLAALVLAKNELRLGEEVPMEVDDVDDTVVEIVEAVVGEEQLKEKPLRIDSAESVQIAKILEDAQRSSRHCDCEGRSGTTDRDIQRCQDCHTTTCVKCGRRPEHNYTIEKAQRLPPSEFEKELSAALQMRIRVEGITRETLEAARAVNGANVADKGWEMWSEAVLNALVSTETEFRFKSLTRQDIWTAVYHAPDASLELMLNPAMPQWQLFVKAPESAPMNSPLRRLLEQPVARMRLGASGSSFFEGKWQICIPAVHKFSIEIKGCGEKVPSYEARIGLQEEYANKKWWSKINVSVVPESEDAKQYLDRDISGTYTLHEKCGTAMGALHKREKTDDLADIFLFLDPTRAGEPEQDPFVFSSSIRRYNYGEERPIIARVDTKWRPNAKDSVQKISCEANGTWLIVDAVKFAKSGAAANATYAMPDPEDLSVNITTKGCEAATAMLLAKVPLKASADDDDLWPRGRWSEVDLQHKGRATFEALSWITERLPTSQGISEWVDAGVGDLDASKSSCERCAPSAPIIKWLSGDKGYVPYEDPIEAGAYEQSLKKRPSPFVVQLRLENGFGLLRIGANITSLLHRALHLLAKTGSNKTQKPRLSWRLDMNHDATRFFDPNTRFSLSSNKKDPEHSQPPLWSEEFPLRPEQLRSLGWMLRQESKNAPPFIEEEIEEALLKPLGWRAEARATRAVHGRGGVVADEVGYGKTAITLGLVASTLEEPLVARDIKPEVDGVIPVKATLVLVPAHLTKQWPSEVEKFTENNLKIVAIPTVAELNKLTVAKIQEADIVICSSSVFGSDLYWSNLAALGGNELPNNKAGGRHFDDKLSETLQTLKKQVIALTAEGGVKQVLSNIETAREEAAERAAEEAQRLQSKRLKGKKYRDAQKKKAAGDSDSEDEPVVKKPVKKNAREDKDPWKLGSAAKKDWKQLHCPPLEMFHWKRVVIDEYTYLSGREHAAVIHMKASARWVLSGTPPVFNFSAVKSIAVFLGISLGIDDESDLSKKQKKEQTAAERFHAFRDARSASWHARRHEVAQAFLDQFMRQNVAEIDEIPTEYHLNRVTLPAAERAIYLELEHYLQALDMNIRRKGKKSTHGDRDARLAEALGKSSSSEEALLKRCSHFDLDEKDDKENAIQACDIIVQERTGQLEDCKRDLLRILIKTKDAHKRAMKEAHGFGEVADPWKEFRASVSDKRLGDLEAAEAVSDLLAEVEAGAKIEKKSKSSKNKDRYDSDDDPSKKKPKTVEEIRWDARERVHGVRAVAKELVLRFRSLRYFTIVRDIQKRIELAVECPGCHNQISTENVAVMSSCGHTGCYECLLRSAVEKERCVSEDCLAAARSLNVIKSETLGVEDESLREGRHFGVKLEKVVRLIKDIPEDERILLFVQFSDLMEKVALALSEHRIDFLQVEGSAHKKSSNLQRFQDGQARVLLLNAGDESASGANLTVANNIIFLSPLLADTQQKYDAAETQAIGRARRYGQQKTVHIWRFLSNGTIDEEIFESRAKQVTGGGRNRT